MFVMPSWDPILSNKIMCSCIEAAGRSSISSHEVQTFQVNFSLCSSGGRSGYWRSSPVPLPPQPQSVARVPDQRQLQGCYSLMTCLQAVRDWHLMHSILHVVYVLWVPYWHKSVMERSLFLRSQLTACCDSLLALETTIKNHWTHPGTPFPLHALRLVDAAT